MALHIQHLRSISSLSLSALRVLHSKQSLTAFNDKGDDAITIFNGEKILNFSRFATINQMTIYRAAYTFHNRRGIENCWQRTKNKKNIHRNHRFRRVQECGMDAQRRRESLHDMCESFWYI